MPLEEHVRNIKNNRFRHSLRCQLPVLISIASDLLNLHPIRAVRDPIQCLISISYIITTTYHIFCPAWHVTEFSLFSSFVQFFAGSVQESTMRLGSQGAAILWVPHVRTVSVLHLWKINNEWKLTKSLPEIRNIMVRWTPRIYIDDLWSIEDV